MDDTLVFDIETSNFFTDPDVGWNNFGALKISVVALYSYKKNEYVCFDENELGKLIPYFEDAAVIVGFSMNRYDVPVLNTAFRKLSPQNEKLDLWKKERVDLLDLIELQTGKRISLSRLSEANLGEKKEFHGAAAITMYQAGDIEGLKTYCLKDVELTKKLYDRFLERNSLLIPSRETGESVSITFPDQTKLFTKQA